MRNRRKRVRRRDGSVYVRKTKRDRWKSRRMGANRVRQPSIDRTKHERWSGKKDKVSVDVGKVKK